MKKLINTLSLLLFAFLGIISAQNADSRIIATSFYNGSEVLIRWIPGDYESFDDGITEGYEILRYTLAENNIRLSIADMRASETAITPSGVFPEPLVNWANLSLADNDIKNIGEAAIYSDEFILTDMSTVDPLKIYSLNKEKENRYSFGLYAADQAYELAEYMGLAFTDQTANPNNEYGYKVKIKNSVNDALDGYTSVITTYEASAKPVIENIEDNPGDRMVQLRWDGKAYAKEYPLGYYIEKSYDQSTWALISDKPLIYIQNEEVTDQYIYFQDSLRANDEITYYRVRGKTFFDGYGPYSEISTEGVHAPLAAQLYIESVVELTEVDQVKLNWHFPQELDAKVAYYQLYRNHTRYGEYSLIENNISNTSRETFDIAPINTAYYKMTAVDIHGQEVHSFPILFQLNDLEAPTQPVDISCTCDKQGNVSISWSKNTELDIKSYSVYSSNHKNSEDYIEISHDPIYKNNFQTKIQLENLTKLIYFKVRAKDFRENYSLLSLPCTLEKPDIIPPTSAALYAVDPLVVGVGLHYQVSTSEDIVSQFIQRKRDGGVWETIAFVDDINQSFIQDLEDEDPTFDNKNPYKEYQYIDTTVSFNAYYTYRITAVDAANNKSYSNAIRVKPHDPGVRGEIENLNAKFQKPVDINQKGHEVVLTWDYTYTKGLYDFQIFRSSNSPQYPNAQYPSSAHAVKHIHDDVAGISNFTSVNYTGSTSFEFIDEGVDIDRKYVYQVMARHVDGGFSTMSVKVSPSSK